MGFFFFFFLAHRQNFKQLVILFLVTILFSEFICDWLIIETSNWLHFLVIDLVNYNLGTIARSGRDQEIHGGAAWFFYTVVGYRIIIPFCSSYVGFGCDVISKVHSIFFLGL